MSKNVIYYIIVINIILTKIPKRIKVKFMKYFLNKNLKVYSPL